MLLRVLMVVISLATATAKDNYKEQRKGAATAFCGGKNHIISTDKSGQNFIFKCKGDDSTLSGVVQQNVLYSIYGNRSAPQYVQKTELLDPGDKVWTDWVRLTKRIQAERNANAIWTSFRPGGLP